MANSIDTSGSSDIRTDYMKLLVTQLQNQNPLEPMDNNQMSAQLAQFSQLEQLEKMNSQFAEMLSALDGAQASHLLGKQISFQPEHTDGLMPPVEGIVEEIQTSEDDIHLFVGNYQVKLSDVLSIKNP